MNSKSCKCKRMSVDRYGKFTLLNFFNVVCEEKRNSRIGKKKTVGERYWEILFKKEWQRL